MKKTVFNICGFIFIALQFNLLYDMSLKIFEQGLSSLETLDKLVLSLIVLTLASVLNE